MLREKKKKNGFVEMWLNEFEKVWKPHWLKRVKEQIKWNKFSYRIEKMYSKDEGRPAIDPMILYRCLILGEWYGLSNENLEEAMRFRVDFRKFAGLDWEESAPDATRYCVFRKRIGKLMGKLLEILNKQLEEAGFEVQKCVAVDASLVEAHSKPVGGAGGDPEASWRGFPVKKHKDKDGNDVISRRPALYSYKLNLSVSVGDGFVSKLSVCKGSEHETHHLLPLLTKNAKEVYADKGYVGKKNKLKNSIKDFIQFKANKNKPLTACQRLFNKTVVPKRRIVEAVFGSWKQWYTWRKTKYMGLAKNQAAAIMTAIAWNIKKWGKLSPPLKTAAHAA